MTRPIPIFKLVFAAYYATSHKGDFEEECGLGDPIRHARSKFPSLALVVDNCDPTPRKSLGLCKKAREFKIE
jgi:hypothetical protein